MKKIAISLTLLCINTLAMDTITKTSEVIPNAAYCVLKNTFGKQVGNRILPRQGTVTYYRSHGKKICTKPIAEFHYHRTDNAVKPMAYFFKNFFNQGPNKVSITVFYDKYKYQLCSYTSAQNKIPTLENIAGNCLIHLADSIQEAKEKTLFGTYLSEGAHIIYQS